MLFKTKQEKENEMKLLINRTVTMMQKQIKMLEAQKKALAIKAKSAHENGMEENAECALAACRQLDAQLAHAKQCLSSYEIAAEIKETADMTAEFLKAMAIMSKEMGSLTSDKSYTEIEHAFKKSMDNSNVQSEHLVKILNLEKRLFAAPIKEHVKEESQTQECTKPENNA